MILIPFPLIRLYGNLHQQWQLVFPFYLWRSYCCLCLIVICVSYTSIALKFWCGTRPPSRSAANRQRKLTVTLFIMTIVSLLLWLPYVVYTFNPFYVLDKFSFRTYLRLKLSFSLLYHTNSLVNPIIYTIRMPEFIRALLILFKRRQRQNAAIPLQARYCTLCNTKRGFLGRPHIFIDSVKHHQNGPPRDCLKANNCKCRGLLWRLLNFLLKHRH